MLYFLCKSPSNERSWQASVTWVVLIEYQGEQKYVSGMCILVSVLILFAITDG